MPSINVLSREISELIAAGEVIERPSSVIKELIENSIDAGSSHITVEIKRGGSTFIRITDDGCGISYEDVPKAFLRHATSKIKNADDLNSILTLGFRGEALASVCAVSRTEIMTRQKEDELGTHYMISGSEENLYEKTGCPYGTTIIIRDLFYNVPARQKFMKKDAVEGNMVVNIVNRIALSHPEVAFKLIKDNRLEFSTAGDGKLYSSMFAVYGKAFAGDMIPVEYEQDGIKISGFTVKPLYSRSNRSFQNFFVNDRYVKSQVCTSAVEEAYKGSIMTGKFPACVLRLEISPETIDVNVHPAKVEIRFSDDRPVYDCLFFAVKSALMNAGLVYDFQLKAPSQAVPEQQTYVQPELPLPAPEEKNTEPAVADTPVTAPVSDESVPLPAPESAVSVQPADTSGSADTGHDQTPDLSDDSDDRPVQHIQVPHTPVKEEQPSGRKSAPDSIISADAEKEPVRQGKNSALNTKQAVSFTSSVSEKPASVNAVPEIQTEPEDDELKEKYSFITGAALKKKAPEPVQKPAEQERPEIRYIGEVFGGYILAETEGKMIIVDKHAAHERIIFERLRSENKEPASQLVLCPTGVLLSLDEAQALAENTALLDNMGFSLDFSGSPYVAVKAMPVILADLNMDEIIPELAENLRQNRRDPRPEAIDDILHTMACRAAIKMNDKNSDMELKKMVEDVYFNDKIRHCPHGRPVLFVISKYDFEKQFRRIV
ncbi:MAG: DNA mismatch repair endonuclease MutL [Oscillospiraceae bacterium]|nr:DNA mismatch repair endonuclease MutL [Oscillospiraceae bacterium]